MDVTQRATCCNPFKKQKHNNVRSNLRNVLDWMTNFAPIATDQRICDSCRKEISSLKSNINTNQGNI